MVSILLVFPCISDGLNKLEVVTDHGIEGVYGPYFADVTEDLDFFEISKTNLLISTRNFIENKS